MNSTLYTLAILFAVACAVLAAPEATPKTEVSGRHNDVAARVNLGTAISLVVPVALGVALIAMLAPIFQGLFASPIPFGPALGYARKSKALFSGINQESIMQVLDTVTKAIDAYAEADADKAKPKL